MAVPRLTAVLLPFLLALACDNSERNERIATVEKKAEVPDADEEKKLAERKAKRVAEEKAKSDAEEARRVALGNITVLPDKLPKKLDEACQAVSDAHDRLVQRNRTGDALVKWANEKDNELPMTVVQCASANSIEVAACQANALDKASPELADHTRQIFETCIKKFAPATPAMATGGGAVIPKRPR